MTPTKQQLIDAIEHISFEMNRYLYTAHPVQLPGRYREIVAESCLLHSRNIGEFFFDKVLRDGDIRISHYYDELISKSELDDELEKSKSIWTNYKNRINKKLGHLTFARVDEGPMNMKEKEELNFNILIELFEKNLPIHFREKWERGRSFSIDKRNN